MNFKYKKLKKNKGKTKDILLNPRKDRRLLANVPDKEAIRDSVDRRGKKVLEDYNDDHNAFIKSKKAGIRYIMETDIKVMCKNQKSNSTFTVKSIDVSTTGILLELKDKEQLNIISNANSIKLEFKVLPGSMPEGYEMNVKINGKKVRDSVTSEGKVLCGIEFMETLSEYSNRKKDRYILAASSLLLLFISIFIMLMRAESIIYFKFNKWIYLYSIIAAVFLLSRYLFGGLYKPMPIDVNYTPGVTIIHPLLFYELNLMLFVNT